MLYHSIGPGASKTQDGHTDSLDVHSDKPVSDIYHSVETAWEGKSSDPEHIYHENTYFEVRIHSYIQTIILLINMSIYINTIIIDSLICFEYITFFFYQEPAAYEVPIEELFDKAGLHVPTAVSKIKCTMIITIEHLQN